MILEAAGKGGEDVTWRKTVGWLDDMIWVRGGIGCDTVKDGLEVGWIEGGEDMTWR